MILSVLLHGILGVGLLAFDGLAAKPWPEVGAGTSAPSFIEVEMLSSQLNSKKSSPILQSQVVQVQAVAVPNKKDVQKQPEASPSLQNDIAASAQAIDRKSVV